MNLELYQLFLKVVVKGVSCLQPILLVAYMEDLCFQSVIDHTKISTR